jgi:hypothetical protein
VLLTYCAKAEAIDRWTTVHCEVALRTMELMKDRLRTENYKILELELGSKPAVLAEAKHFRSVRLASDARQMKMRYRGVEEPCSSSGS